MPKHPLLKLSALEPGAFADFFAQLAEKTPRTTRDGKRFYVCKFRDAQRAVGVTVWADSPLFEECKDRWQPGAFFKVRGRYDIDARYGPKVEIEQLRPVVERDVADGFREADFVERPRSDPGQAFADLTALAGELADAPLRTLVQNILAAHADRLKAIPASVGKYYPVPGGWVEHTLNVARHAALLADQYLAHYPDLTPPLNRDLVLAGAVLHDVGRVREFDEAAPALAPKPGIDGELFGHLLLGVELVRDAARDVPDLNPELLRLLCHVVYTHLKIPEWGSPRLPAIPEVLIVHHADDLDAKFEMYARCLTKDAADGPFTEPDPVLRRPLLKGRTV